MFRKLAYIGKFESGDSSANQKIFKRSMVRPMSAQQIQSLGMIPEFNDTRPETKVWSRDLVGAESLLLLVSLDARVMENRIYRQFSAENEINQKL